MAGRTRNLAADALVVIAVLLVIWWLLRKVIAFVVGLVGFLVLAVVVLVLLSLADRIRNRP